MKPTDLNKIHAIKTLRKHLDVGLKEAKDIIEDMFGSVHSLGDLAEVESELQQLTLTMRDHFAMAALHNPHLLVNLTPGKIGATDIAARAYAVADAMLKRRVERVVDLEA